MTDITLHNRDIPTPWRYWQDRIVQCHEFVPTPKERVSALVRALYGPQCYSITCKACGKQVWLSRWESWPLDECPTTKQPDQLYEAKENQ